MADLLAIRTHEPLSIFASLTALTRTAICGRTSPV